MSETVPLAEMLIKLRQLDKLLPGRNSLLGPYGKYMAEKLQDLPTIEPGEFVTSYGRFIMELIDLKPEDHPNSPHKQLFGLEPEDYIELYGFLIVVAEAVVSEQFAYEVSAAQQKRHVVHAKAAGQSS